MAVPDTPLHIQTSFPFIPGGPLFLEISEASERAEVLEYLTKTISPRFEKVVDPEAVDVSFVVAFVAEKLLRLVSGLRTASDSRCLEVPTAAAAVGKESGSCSEAETNFFRAYQYLAKNQPLKLEGLDQLVLSYEGRLAAMLREREEVLAHLRDRQGLEMDLAVSMGEAVSSVVRRHTAEMDAVVLHWADQESVLRTQQRAEFRGLVVEMAESHREQVALTEARPTTPGRSVKSGEVSCDDTGRDSVSQMGFEYVVKATHEVCIGGHTLTVELLQNDPLSMLFPVEFPSDTESPRSSIEGSKGCDSPQSHDPWRSTGVTYPPDLASARRSGGRLGSNDRSYVVVVPAGSGLDLNATLKKDICNRLNSYPIDVVFEPYERQLAALAPSLAAPAMSFTRHFFCSWTLFVGHLIPSPEDPSVSAAEETDSVSVADSVSVVSSDELAAATDDLRQRQKHPFAPFWASFFGHCRQCGVQHVVLCPQPTDSVRAVLLGLRQVEHVVLSRVGGIPLDSGLGIGRLSIMLPSEATQADSIACVVERFCDRSLVSS